MKLKLFFLLIVSSIATQGLSQNAILETNPASVKWEQINTPYFKIIFPIGAEQAAQRTANLLETVYEPGALTMDEFPKKTPVIIQDRSAVSNAFVSFVPYRSEFQTFPSQRYTFTGNNDWLELISFHEYRHMVQMNKSVTGFNKFLHILFGQATTGSFANFAAPAWFWEGDAVVTETVLTESGRGRIPEFSMVMRSNLLEKGAFNYNKQTLGSFKHFVPNEYATGYFFNGYLREKYGRMVMGETVQNAWSWSFVPFTFSNSLHKTTGKFLVKNYNEFMDHQEEKWEDQIEALGVEDYSPINNRKNEVFTNYQYPALLNDGSVFAVKTGLGDIATFIKINQDGREEKIFVPGFVNSADKLSTNGQQIVWTEIIPDLRWGARAYSDIKIYDLESEEERRVSRKKRYIAPAISPDGERIVTVETDNNGNNKLILLNLNGEVLDEYQDSNNSYFLHPDFTESSSEILMIKLHARKKTLVKYDFDSDREEIIAEFGYENVGYPRFFGDYIFYNSPHNGIGNIYVIDQKSGKHYQVTNAKYGAYNPWYDVKNGILYFNAHSENGHNIIRIDFDPEKLKEKESVDVDRDELPEILAYQESGIIQPEEVANFDFPIEKYSKAAHMINPHSWGVTVNSLNNEYDFFINSRDLLNTTSINAGYSYNVNENTGRYEVNASYQALYPILDLRVFDGGRGFNEEFNDTTYSFSWDERGVDFGVRVPFNLTNNKYNESVMVGAEVGLHQIDNYPSYPYERRYRRSEGSLQSLSGALTYQRMLKRSKRDIYGKFGQIVRLNIKSTPFLGDFNSFLASADAIMFFPGLFKHHSFFVRGAYQFEDKWNYTFTSPLVFPRGYSYSSFDNFYMASVNYTLPLWYPDIALGPVLNIQRIRANLFYDYGYGEREINVPIASREDYYNSFGVEMNFNFNVMRFHPLLDAGFRVNYLPEIEDYSVELVIGTLGF